jgi:hypothetical protein
MNNYRHDNNWMFLATQGGGAQVFNADGYITGTIARDEAGDPLKFQTRKGFELDSKELRAIADKLDALNGVVA